MYPMSRTMLAGVLGSVGGLALFLYGMLMMSAALEGLAGKRLEKTLRRFTGSCLKAFLTGTAVTALLHSSSAVMVLLIGFVNAGVIGLEQAAGVVMGANLGTTITGQLTALPLSSLAPVLCLVGMLFQLCGKNEKIRQGARAVAGFGVLLVGMETMKRAVMPLAKSQAAQAFFLKLGSPLAGILGGAAFTALIQSSTAAVAVVQALLESGAMDLYTAAFLIFGQNIGTCATSFLASMGGCRNGKRAAFLHLLFNLAGTLLFTGICLWTPFLGWVERLTPANPAAQAANVHTIHNLVTALLLLPFCRQLAVLTRKLLP